VKIRTFGIGVAILVFGLAVWGVWTLTHQWAYEQVGPYAVRRNVITGIAEVQADDGTWNTGLWHDSAAPILDASDLKEIQLTRGAWGPDGILCGRAVNRSAIESLNGRVAIHIDVSTFDSKRVKDRTLRGVVRWPAGASTPFVLDTQLPTPTPSQKWKVDLVPMYDDATPG
jgi:hypothetical protein